MKELVADKGFDSAAFRRELTARGIKTCIPQRKYKHRRKTRTAAAFFFGELRRAVARRAVFRLVRQLSAIGC